MKPEPGRRFGPYQILDRLGGGGMGHVYRAWDARLHREVALKLLHNEYGMPGMRERFLLEARAASALNHPNICTVFDIGEQDGDPYLVMELLEGESLKDRLQDGPMERNELLCIAREMAEALGAAHAKGVVHRDVKPGNVFLVKRPNGTTQAKILDFGLAKMERRGLRSAREADLTTIGATVGTLAYMSPEQARGETLDARSDLFSLGVVMYEMATGKIPFPGATSALVFVKLLGQPPEPIRNLNEAIPRELERVIQRLLAKEPAARFQTAFEAEQAIRQIQERSASGAGWLRRAVDAAATGRAGKPVSREGRQAAGEDDRLDRRDIGGLHAVATPVPETLRLVGSDGEVLRPVARVLAGKAAAGVLSQPLPSIPREQLVRQSAQAPVISTVGLESGPRTPVPAAVRATPVPVTAVAEVMPKVVADPVAAVPPSVSRPVAKVVPSEVKAGRSPWRWAVLVALVLLIAGLVWALRQGQPWPLGRTVLPEHEAVLIAGIANLTSDRGLDSSVSEAFDLAFRQTPYLEVIDRNGSSVPGGASARQAAGRGAAQRAGAREYVFGTLRHDRAPFALQVAVFDTASDKLLASVDQTVASEAEMAGAIDAVSSQLRLKLGEPRASVARSSLPLAAEATTNFKALGMFAEAEDAEIEGRLLLALDGYQRATQQDPNFTQGQLGLARIYAALHAEVAAADASRRALAADHASDRTHALAEAAYEVDASGDLPRAAVTLGGVVAAAPHDSLARAQLAQVLRLEGRLPEALATAQAGCPDTRPDIASCHEAAIALIGLDRYDEAKKILLGTGDGDALRALASAQPEVHSVLEMRDAGSPVSAAAWRVGMSVDAGGSLAEGAELWRVQAAAAGLVPGLESTASFLLAQGAINRALLGDCHDGLPMAHQAGTLPSGMTSLFHQGITEALCGDAAGAVAARTALRTRYPQGYVVNGFMLADLDAALALREGNPQAAVEELEAARGFDSIAPSALLRGWAYAASGQLPAAETEFEWVLAHRGAGVVSGNNGYAAAEIGLARAFAAAGDKTQSAAAYRRLVELWANGDRNQPLLTEAIAHSK
jgi:serine/threonine-protein kinase